MIFPNPKPLATIDSSPQSLKEELLKDIKLFAGLFLSGFLAFLLFAGYSFFSKAKLLNAKFPQTTTIITAASTEDFLANTSKSNLSVHFGKVLCGGLTLICFTFFWMSIAEWRDRQQWTINYNRTYGQR